jgi:hypothetical protein
VAFGTTVEELRSKLTEEQPAGDRPKSEDFSEQRVLRPADPPPAPPAQSPSAGDRFLRNLYDEED